MPSSAAKIKPIGFGTVVCFSSDALAAHLGRWFWAALTKALREFHKITPPPTYHYVKATIIIN
jgi:hypothetical protein